MRLSLLKESPLYALEYEGQARHEERQEEEWQKPLTGASKGDHSALGYVEGLRSTRVAAAAELESMVARFDRELCGFVQVDRPNGFAVHQNLVRSATDLRANCTMGQ